MDHEIVERMTGSLRLRHELRVWRRCSPASLLHVYMAVSPGCRSLCSIGEWGQVLVPQYLYFGLCPTHHFDVGARNTSLGSYL